jgi:nucleoside phosphorylase
MFDPRVNVNIVVALMAEAKPFVERLTLSLDAKHAVFKLYTAPGVNLIVSGMGRNNAAAATAYLGARTAEMQAVSVWINAGIAGHSSLSIGDLVIAHKILEKSTGRNFYPQVYPVSLTSTLLTTVDQPETDYLDESAFDMEASGFAAVASKFSPLECIQSVKVISDNAQSGVEVVSVQSIEGAMQENAKAVIKLVEVMLPSAIHRVSQTQLADAFQSMLARARFSATQVAQLKRLCQRYSALGLEQRLTEIAAMEIESSKKIIQHLDAQLLLCLDPAQDL